MKRLSELISYLDGNSIITTGYDEEPSINEYGLKKITETVLQWLKDEVVLEEIKYSRPINDYDRLRAEGFNNCIKLINQKIEEAR